MRPVSLGVALLLLLGVAAPRAWAGADANGDFVEDVESGTTLTSEVPAGRWDSLTQLNANVSLVPSAAAARRGAFGLRVTDTDATLGAGSSVFLLAGNLNATSPSYHLRFWFRVNHTAAGADTLLATLQDGNTWYVEVRLSGSGTALRMTGRNAGDTFTESPGTRPIVDGRWYLVEVAATGLGTALGTRSLFVDGELVTQSSQDWTGVFFNRLRVGECYGDDRLFQGTMDFDDVRASPTAHASRLTIEAAGTEVGVCTPLLVGLSATATGAAVPAPYLVEADLSSAGSPALAFFQDPGCTQPLGQASLPAGALSTQLHFRATSAGTATLGAAHLDFLPGSATVVVAPGSTGAPCAGGTDCQSGQCGDGVCCSDACTGDGPAETLDDKLDYRLGCATGASAPLLPGAVVALLALLCQRRARPVCGAAARGRCRRPAPPGAPRPRATRPSRAPAGRG